MKLVIVLLALILAPLSDAVPDQSPNGVGNWFSRLPNAQEKLTRLHFYIHDIMTGPNPTTVPIAQANITDASPTKFGLVYVMDSPLTVGPSLDSKIIGRCQGTFAFASQEEIGLLLTLNFVFTDGIYAGSTLSVLGPKKRDNFYREYPIIGGSGVFRLAEGVSTDHTYQGTVAPGAKAPTDTTVYVLHYDVAAANYAEEVEMNHEYAEVIEFNRNQKYAEDIELTKNLINQVKFN
ncbi:OLC1v1012493C2 [Oldenlandia corymbosa var. corymbosa]|nr:OLC1v1012493C2 [Oldenlandia corymbosa var. corymbosa]